MLFSWRRLQHRYFSFTSFLVVSWQGCDVLPRGQQISHKWCHNEDFESLTHSLIMRASRQYFSNSKTTWECRCCRQDTLIACMFSMKKLGKLSHLCLQNDCRKKNMSLLWPDVLFQMEYSHVVLTDKLQPRFKLRGSSFSVSVMPTRREICNRKWDWEKSVFSVLSVEWGFHCSEKTADMIC